MVSKRWQKQQTYIQHSSLFLLWGGPLFWLQLDIPAGAKLMLIIATCGIALIGGVYLNRRFARSIVRVFTFEEDVATGIVQRSLNARYIPFNRKYISNEVHFTIRDKGLTLVVEPYPLNLPIDDRIASVPASKIEIRGLSATNRTTADQLCLAINETVAAARS